MVDKEDIEQARQWAREANQTMHAIANRPPQQQDVAMTIAQAVGGVAKLGAAVERLADALLAQ